MLAKFAAPVSSYPAVTPVKGAASLKGKTVWFVPIGQSVPVVAAMGAAMSSALAHQGIKTHLCDGQLLPTTVASCLNQAVTQGASAVVTAYVDYKMVPTAMNNVVAHKIPLLVAGETDDAGSSAGKLLGFYNTNPAIRKSTSLAVDGIIADSHGKAHILFIGAKDSPSLVATNTYAAQLVKTRCPTCTFNALTYLTPDLPKLTSQVSASLVRYPDTNYILAAEDISLRYVTQGIDSSGFGSKLKIFTETASLAPLQMMKSGSLVTEDVGNSATYTGWSFADGIIRMMLGQNPRILVGGIRVFNQQNVKGLALTPTAYATNQWYGPPTFESLFLKAWAGR